MLTKNKILGIEWLIGLLALGTLVLVGPCNSKVLSEQQTIYSSHGDNEVPDPHKQGLLSIIARDYSK